jgi:hypothetical protein
LSSRNPLTVAESAYEEVWPEVYVREYVPLVTSKLVQQLSLGPVAPARQLLTPSVPVAQFGIACVELAPPRPPELLDPPAPAKLPPPDPLWAEPPAFDVPTGPPPPVPSPVWTKPPAPSAVSGEPLSARPELPAEEPPDPPAAPIGVGLIPESLTLILPEREHAVMHPPATISVAIADLDPNNAHARFGTREIETRMRARGQGQDAAWLRLLLQDLQKIQDALPSQLGAVATAARTSSSVRLG